MLGKNISKWRIESKYYTNFEELEIVGGTKRLEKHNHYPRILIRRTGNTLCCALLNEKALTESTLYSCWSNFSSISNKYLISLLNSKILDYYIKKLMITNQQGFPQILMTDLALLPVIIPRENCNVFLDKLVDYTILSFDKLNDNFFERLINAIVYELYLPKEVTAAGANVLCHLQNLPDIQPLIEKGETEKALKTIENIYKELSDPKHPVSMAMVKMRKIPEVKLIEGKE